jgi:hypothetical protein
MVLRSLPRARTVRISSLNVIELFLSPHFLSISCAQCTKNDGSVCRIPQHTKAVHSNGRYEWIFTSEIEGNMYQARVLKSIKKRECIPK